MSLYPGHSWWEKSKYFVLLHVIHIVIEEKSCTLSTMKYFVKLVS